MTCRWPTQAYAAALFGVFATPVWLLAQTPVRVSVAHDGSQLAEGVVSYERPAASDGGRFVVFVSSSPTVVPGDTNGQPDVFVRDTQAATTTRVSVATGGAQANGASGGGSISADGRYIAFHSDATNLVAGDTNASHDAFVHDRLTGVTTRVSVTTSGGEDMGYSQYPVISADGRFVAFHGLATLDARDHGYCDVYWHDRQTGVTRLVSTDSAGQQTNGPSFYPSISHGGRYVAFYSAGSTMVPGDPVQGHDVFLKDMDTEAVWRASSTPAGQAGNDWSTHPIVSPDGRYVTFKTEASDLSPETEGLGRISWTFLFDRIAGTTTLIGRAPNGEGLTAWPAGFAGNGRFAIAGNVIHVAVELSTGRRLSLGPLGWPISTSTDGVSVVYMASAALDPADTNAASDAYVKPSGIPTSGDPAWTTDTYATRENLAFAGSGGVQTIIVDAPAGSSWTPVSTASWLTVTASEPPVGVLRGVPVGVGALTTQTLLTVTAAPNTSLSGRAATFSAHGLTIAVTQQGAAPVDTPDWLAYVNEVRVAAGATAVIEQPAWSHGAFRHAVHDGQAGSVSHTESPSSVWYSAAGYTAARSGNVMGSSSTVVTDRDIIDTWLSGPFHAVGVFDPRLTSTGFGRFSDASLRWHKTTATLDVVRGRSAGDPAPGSMPIRWPGAGSTVRVGSYPGGEYPDPLPSCAGYVAPTGLPVLLMVGPTADLGVSASRFAAAGVALEHCVFTEETYVNSNASLQTYARGVLAGRGTVVLIPRAPLVSGTNYDVSITVGGVTHAWSFRFDAAAAPPTDPPTDPEEPTPPPPAPPPPGDLSHSQYFAEGATSALFDTRFAFLNTGTSPANVRVTFQRTDGTNVATTLVIASGARATLDPKALPGLEAAEFSTRIDSDRPVVADRTMLWGGATRYGGHTEGALTSPSLTWYLAEGATHSGLDLFYLLQNPNASSAEVRVRFLRPTGAPVEKTYLLSPRSRTNIWVDAELFDGEPLLANTDVSGVVSVGNGQPIIVERAVYLTGHGRFFDAGHESAGVTAPAASWFLAEGATGPLFDLFVLIANPTGDDADVRLTFLLPDGRTFSKTVSVLANSRFNVWVDHEAFDGVAGLPLSDTAVSTIVESVNGVPIIVERAMWWGASPGNWHEAHNTPGSTATGTTWAMADGEVGGSEAVETYLLIANTSSQAGQARVTVMFENGTRASREYVLPPRSRTNVPIASDFPAAANRRFGALVESIGTTPAPIVVERAMYWNAGGVFWAAGTNALATRVP
ncbi:MAG: hypothetical protein JNM38_13355 [Acidobacteria bacterium]|nr:hypothetical protein [Acidobacteriota bacterium]